MKRLDRSDQPCRILDCGLTQYREAYEFQKELFYSRLEGNGEDTLLITRHEPTITMGKTGRDRDLLVSKDVLSNRGVDFVEIDRGGGITYHGPGQLVLYPLLDLRNYGKDLREFVRKLGLVAKSAVDKLGLDTVFREGDEIGLWVKGEESKKLGSLGIRVKRWYTMHGLALNVSLDNEKAGLIKPCGIGGAELVSITDFVGDVELDEVKELLLTEFCRKFSHEG